MTSEYPVDNEARGRLDVLKKRRNAGSALSEAEKEELESLMIDSGGVHNFESKGERLVKDLVGSAGIILGVVAQIYIHKQLEGMTESSVDFDILEKLEHFFIQNFGYGLMAISVYLILNGRINLKTTLRKLIKKRTLSVLTQEEQDRLGGLTNPVNNNVEPLYPETKPPERPSAKIIPFKAPEK